MTAPQKSPEWHQARRGKITGSIAGAILGLSPYMMREDVLRMMVREYHNATSEFVTNPAIEWGNSHETMARLSFQMETGLDVEETGFHTFGDIYGASPDGLIGDDAVFETKCPFSARKEAVFKTLQDQPHYRLQVEMEMRATGRSRFYFWQWSPHGHVLADGKLDDALWASAEPELRAFYDEYLAAIKEPAEYLEPKRIEINTNRSKMLIDEIDNMRDAKDRAEERIAEIMTELEESCGGKDALIWGRKLTKVEKAGAISYSKAVKALVPKADLEPYRGASSQYWKLT